MIPPGDSRPRPAACPSTVRLICAGVVANLAVGTLFGWSLVAPEVMAAVGARPSRSSAVFGLALVVFTATVLWVGRGLRRLSPRSLLGVAAILGGSGLALTAVGGRPEIPWLGIGLLFGAANGMAYGVSLSLAARVVARHRGLASGLIVGAYAAGPVVLGLVAPRTLPEVGWRTCLSVLAVLVTVMVGVAAAVAPRPQPGGAGPGRRDGQVLMRRPTLVALWLLFAGGAFPGLVVFATAAPLAAAAGLDAGAVGFAVSVLAAGNLMGRIGAGWWSDHVGRLAALATTLVMSAVALVGMAVSSAPAVVLLGFAGIGLAYGAVSALVPAVTADRVGARGFPTVYGRVFTAWGCAGLAAALVDGGDSRPNVVLLVCPLLVAAAALVGLARQPRPHHDR